MRAALAELKKDLENALTQGTPEPIQIARQAIGDGYPDTDEGAEANYRLGLTSLFSGQGFDLATKRFRAAAKSKSNRWTPHARVSLGLVLYRQGKTQQAMFEFRKVASVEPPTLPSAQALAFMVQLQTEAGKPKEAERSRVRHFEVLKKLILDATPEVSALAHFMLGMEYKHEGKRAPAKKHLTAALETKALGEDETEQARGALDLL